MSSLRRRAKRRWQLVLLVALIASTMSALRWNRARLAPLPEPSGERLVERRQVSWTDSGRTVSAFAYVPAGEDTLPALLFSPGFGVGPGEYHVFLTEVASRGFLVIAVPHPPIADPDSARLIDVQPKVAASLVAAMDHISESGADSVLGRVDVERVAVFGHSVGGAGAAEACEDGRFRAAVNLDGSMYGLVVHEGVRCPFLLIQRSLRSIDTLDALVFHEERSQGRLHEDSVRAHTREMDWVTVDGLDHMAFTDAGLAFRTGSWMNETLGLRRSAAQTQRATADRIAAFMRRWNVR